MTQPFWETAGHYLVIGFTYPVTHPFDSSGKSGQCVSKDKHRHRSRGVTARYRKIPKAALESKDRRMDDKS